MQQFKILINKKQDSSYSMDGNVIRSLVVLVTSWLMSASATCYIDLCCAESYLLNFLSRWKLLKDVGRDKTIIHHYALHIFSSRLFVNGTLVLLKQAWFITPRDHSRLLYCLRLLEASWNLSIFLLCLPCYSSYTVYRHRVQHYSVGSLFTLATNEDVGGPLIMSYRYCV